MQAFEKTNFVWGSGKMVETGWKKCFCYAVADVLLASMWQVWDHQHLGVKNIRQVMISYVINLWGSFIKKKTFNTHLLQGYFSELKEKNPNSMQGTWAGGKMPASPFSITETVSKWRVKCWMSTSSFPQVGEVVTWAANYVRKELPLLNKW